MKVKFDVKENEAKYIAEQIAKLPEMVEKREVKLMRDMGKIIKAKVEQQLKYGDAVRTNYDGTRPYVHMKDDVIVKVSKKSGSTSAIVMGGKKTGYKWHMHNDGTRNPDGSVKTSATHFIEKAMQQAEEEIETLIDRLMEELSDGG